MPDIPRATLDAVVEAAREAISASAAARPRKEGTYQRMERYAQAAVEAALPVLLAGGWSYPTVEPSVRSRDDTQYLGPQECAVTLNHAEADALLSMLEKANNSGIEPGPGLHVEAAQRAGFKLVGERFRDQDPYNRTSRIVAVVFRPAVGSP